MASDEKTSTTGEANRTDGAPDLPDLDLGNEIGGGVDSVVYRASREGETVAVKVMSRSNRDDDRAAVRRFHREATILASLDHRAFAEIYAIETNESWLYTVMEYIDGPTLSERMQADDWDDERAVNAARAVAEGLQRVHRRGLVHRDIKPKNIVFDPDDRPKLIDFGLALRTDASVESDDIAGTFVYSAPEQTGMLDRPVDGRADLYALGVVLFEALTGRVPFEDDDAAELIRQHAAVEPPRLSEVRSDVEPALEAIVDKLLAKDPDDRYQTCRSLVRDLGRLDELDEQLQADESVQLGSTFTALDVDAHTELVGRVDELERLRDHWSRVQSQSEGGLVIVEGRAGSGKSRLVEELLMEIDPRESLVVRGKCIQGDPAPFAPLRESLAHHLEIVRDLPEGPRNEAMERIRTAAEGSWDWLARFAPELREAVGLEPIDPSGTANSESQEEFFQVVADLWINLADAYGGGLHFIDDVQWLDDASEKVLQQMVEQHDDHPSLFVLTSRNGPKDRSRLESVLESVRAGEPERIELSNFDRVRVRAFVENYLGSRTIPDKLVDRLHTHTDGSPFLIREYLIAMLDNGLVRPSRSRWRFDEEGLVDLELSNDVFEFVAQRVADVREETRSLLSAAALMGNDFDRRMLRQLTDVETRQLNEAISQALRARLIERTSGSNYRFVHDRIRETLLSILPEDRERNLHQRAAEALEKRAATDKAAVFAMARHFSQGHVEEDPERVVAANVRAGELAMRDYAYEEAFRVLQRAYRTADDHSLPADKHLESLYGQASARSGRLNQAVEHLERAIEFIDDPLERARHRSLIAQIHLWDSMSHEPAIEQLRLAFDDIGRPLPTSTIWLYLTSLFYWIAGLFVLRTNIGFGTASGRTRERHAVTAELLRHAGNAYYWSVEPLMVAPLLMRSMFFAHRVGAGNELVLIHGDWAAFLGTLGWNSASDRYIASAVDNAEKSGDRSQIAYARAFENVMDNFQGRARESAAKQDRELADLSRWISVGHYMKLTGDLGWNYFYRGYVEKAHAWMKRAERKLERARSRKQIIYVPARLASSHINLGRHERAIERLEETRKIYERDPDNTFKRVTIHLYDAFFHYEQDQLAEAREAIRKFEEIGLKPQFVPLHLQFGYIFAADIYRASVDEASSESERERFREKFVDAFGDLEAAKGHEVYDAHWMAAEVSRLRFDGALDRAIEKANDVITEATRLDNPWVLFKAHRELALLLRNRDNDAMARRNATAALDIASQRNWFYRQRKIRAEFSLDPTSAHRTPFASLSESASERERPGIGMDEYFDTLLQISLAASDTGAPKQRLDAILDEAVSILGAERGLLLLASEDFDTGDDLEIFAARDSDSNDLELDDSYTHTVIEQVRASREPIVVGTTEAGRRLGAISMVTNEIRSVVAAPLVMQEELVGVIYLDSRTTKALFTDRDLDFLLAIANHIPVILETLKRARLESRVDLERQQRDFADRLSRLTAEMNATFDAVSAFERLAESVARLLPHDGLIGFTRRGDDFGAWFEATRNGGARDPWRLETLEPDFEPGEDRLIEKILNAQTPFVVRTDSDGDTLDASGLGSETRAALCIPVCSHDHHLGGLIVASSKRDRFGTSERELGRTLATQAGMAIENVRLATRDQLTGLINRRRFFQVAHKMLDRATDGGEQLSAIILDVDEFKRFNDDYGHAAGDTVLREISRRMREVLDERARLGRYGGEEFAVVAPNATLEETADLAERIRAAVDSHTVDWEGEKLRVTISLGVATLSQADDSLSDLFERADRMLYRAKEQGRNCVVKS